MQVHVFKGQGRVFAVTTDAAGANLPSKYAPWAAFKSIELQRGVATLGLDVEECWGDLETYGLHVTDAHQRITEQALSQ
jgi:hypothetical protein